MAIALVASASAQAVSSPATSGIDTTGANLIVLSVASYASPSSISDSKGNTWTALTEAYNSTGHVYQRLYYCVLPTVGTGHTFTASGSNIYATVSATAWSGVDTSAAFDAQNTYTSDGHTGSVTPTNDNSLLVYGSGERISGETTYDYTGVDVGTLLFHHGSAGTGISAATAYEIQTTKTTRNPLFSYSAGSPNFANSIAVFKAAAGGAPEAVASWFFFSMRQGDV